MSEPDKIDQAINATALLHTLVITVMANGQLNVNGPIKQELLCLRILADAARSVMEYNARQRASGVIVPGVTVPKDLMGGNGRGTG